MAEQATPIDSAARMSHRHLLAALGLLLLLGVAALHRMRRRIDARALDAMRKDEVRQASLSRAWRNGFLAMLALQPMLALGLSWSGAAHGVALMAAGAVTLGAATVLASLLWYDR